MKTLVIKYLPRKERSHTGALLNHFIENINESDTEIVDLTVTPPGYLLPDTIEAYIKRNYLGETLDENGLKAVAEMDRLTEQFLRSDIIVMAFPMYNFSLPAAVKAYFDCVMQKGKTWDADESGYKGLMNGKKALVLLASGGVYDGATASWEHATSLAKTEFVFMGFDEFQSVQAAGMNMMPDKKDEIISEAQQKISTIISKWYGS